MPPHTFDQAASEFADIRIDSPLVNQLPPAFSAPWAIGRVAADDSIVQADGSLSFNFDNTYPQLAPMDAQAFQSVLDNAATINFTTEAGDAKNSVVPDFILGEDGKLRPNPVKIAPNPDSSVNIQLASANKSELDAKNAANQLQRRWAQDMIQRWQTSPGHEGQAVPQEWLDLVAKQDVPAPASDAPTQPQPRPEQPAASPSYDGGGSGSGSGGNGNGGGGMRGGGGNSNGGGGGMRGGGGNGDGGGAINPPDGDTTPRIPADTPAIAPSDAGPMRDVPSVNGGSGLEAFKAAVERARNGGEPVRVLQYGDSHIAGGVEPRAIEAALDEIAPTDFTTKAKSGVSANYPLQHRQEWLDQPIAQANPDLIILSFGSNDSAGAVDKDAYVQNYQKLIDEVRQRAPNASILIVGPSDGNSIVGANKGNTLPGLDAVVAAQKEVAAQNGLEFFDLRESMGGPGSVNSWKEQGLAAGDGLHFTNRGYEMIGRSIGNHIKNGIQ